MKSTPKPNHLLLRFSDILRISGNTISEHQELLTNHGAVWYGKLGRPVSVIVLNKLRQQIEAGIRTNLYLVQRAKTEYEIHVGQIKALTRDFDETDKALIPRYYFNNNLIPQISLWVNIITLEPAAPEILKQLKVSSSAMPVKDSLASSMAAHFIIKEN